MTRISMVSQRASLLLGWLLASGALTAGCAGDFDEYYACLLYTSDAADE